MVLYLHFIKYKILQLTLKSKDEVHKLIESLRQLLPFPDRIQVRYAGSNEQDGWDQDIEG